MTSICIAAYNEEENIEQALRYLEKSLIDINFDKNVKIIVGLNGCNDKTEEVVKRVSKNYNFPFLITHSEKGKIKSHKEMLKLVGANELVFFMDADVLVPGKTILDLENEMKKDKFVKIASGYPYVVSPEKSSISKAFLFNVLNLKRIYPKVEIAKNDVSMYHSAKDEFDKKSRIYFHGRFFAIRNKSIYKFPEDGSKIVGDDTFLTRTTLYQHGKGSIKVLFDSKVYCAPLMSIGSYLKSWYRIRKDIEEINKEYPEFKQFDNKIIMTVNWNYVKNLSLRVKFYALCFFILRKFEAFSFSLIKNRINLNKTWTYHTKEIVGGKF